MDELLDEDIFAVSNLSSSTEIVQTGASAESRDLNYLFVYDKEFNHYEFNTKCEKDMKNDDLVMSKEFNDTNRQIRKNAIDYFKEVINKINTEIQSTSSKIPFKKRLINFLKYFACFIGFLLIIYLLLLFFEFFC